MSHIAVRLLADRLDDPDEGINAILGLPSFPIFDGDPAPPEVRVYNELEHGWLARRKIPQPSELPMTEVEFPCVVVFLASLNDIGGIAAVQSTGARTTMGQVSVVAQLLMQESDTGIGATAGMYILRAMRGVVHRFNDPAQLENRTTAHTQLDAATSIQQGDVRTFAEDSVFSPGSIIVTYPYLETVPLT